MLKQQQYSIELSGSGESKENAFGNIFAQIKQRVAADFPKCLVIQIEPQDVAVVAAQQVSYTERFFGFLFPRKRSRYDVTVVVTVKLRMIDLSTIDFIETTEHPSPLRRMWER